MSMRIIRILLAAVLATISVCSLAETETDRLTQWLDAQYESELQRSPLTLAIYGRKEQYDRVDDMSVAAQIEWLDWLEGSARDMARQFDYDKLTAQGKISYDFWKFRAASGSAQRPFLYHAYIFSQFHGLQSYPIQFLLNYHAVDTRADMLAYIQRVAGFSRALDQSLATVQKAAEMGIRPPRFAYQYVLKESREIISGFPFEEDGGESAVWRDGRTKIESLHTKGLIDQAEATALEAQLQQMLESRMLPAYQRLIAWHEADIKNTSEEALGASSLPDGASYYRERLRYYTHSDMSPDEVHQLGLDEVARIHAEMEKIREEIGFEGSLQDLFQFVREDERFYYPDTDAGREAYLAHTRELLAAMNTRLPEYFGLLPKTPLVVKRVEAYREQDGAAQFYQRGTADGSRPGVYYVHLSDMSAYNTTDLETTAYHEGSPGHHMQISIASTLTDVPKFRTKVSYSAYTEGWALYAELLAREMGGFQDPYNDFGRLVAEIWRAIRLVVDSGLHAKGWSEEQAVNYMLENSAIPEAAVRSEIRRYLVAPGQAVSYKAGMLKIQELRALAESRLGEQFDIRGFHDAVLGGGAVPLPILERAIESWIESRSAGSKRASLD